MIVADASVLIAVLDGRDAHHERARALVETHLGEGFLVHPVTLAEVLVGAVRQGRGTQRLAELNAIGVHATEHGPNEPLMLAELRVSTALPLPDCCVLGAALLSGAPIATFDARLTRAAVAAGLDVVELEVSTGSTRSRATPPSTRRRAPPRATPPRSSASPSP